MLINITPLQHTLLKDTALITGVSVDTLARRIINEWLQTMEMLDEQARFFEKCKQESEGIINVQY